MRDPEGLNAVQRQDPLRIEQLRADGHNTKDAERLLAELQKNLEEWYQARNDIAILKRTDQLPEGTDPPASSSGDGIQD